MGNTLKNVSLVILLLKMCIIFGQEEIPKKRIVIDPGHGGKDSGAIGINGIQEKDVVLNIAKEIVRLNRTVFEDQFEIYLTRYRDTLISLSDRTKLAKGLEADVFVSLHCNHSDNPEARGVEVYVSKKQAGYSKESIWLAFQLHDELNKKLGFESRGVKFADFQVLKETTNCLSFLLEFGFVTNIHDSGYLGDKGNNSIIAALILDNLRTYQ
ncbi:N-acetylmuramoyl-L-alanine amidase family protein [Flagellimonas sp.]|uniref:N-acetylmuramoyl-L-alanine amidase family protein n=1 Tax=Flagellimonas sp. TaxID=2058762 RepID=UPI003BA95DE2